MAVIPVFAREEQAYSTEDLKKALGFDDGSDESKKNFKRLIKDLLARRVLKSVTRSSLGSNEWKENLEEIVRNDYNDENLIKNGKFYKFSFVGIVINRDRIIYSYPKYLIDKDGTDNKLTVDTKFLPQMQQVIKVIQKYCLDKKLYDSFDAFSFYADEGEMADNVLSVMFFLLFDYERNGDYEKTENILEINGEGAINWQRTIDDTFPIISDGDPCYVELYTRKNITDDADYIRRLHRYVVGRCSEEITKALLTNLFDLPVVEPSEEEESSFGDSEYICERIKRELCETFEDRKIMVLKAMLAYFEGSKVLLGDESIQLIGTRSFNMVWEHVCADVFDSQKDEKVNKVFTDIQLYTEYDDTGWDLSQNPTLVQLIEKPRWQKDGGPEREAVGTLNPDALHYDAKEVVLYILDAKYYCPNWNDTKISDEPGVEDIVKQYMYRLAYKNLEKKYTNIEYRNYFLMPRRDEKDDIKGKTWLKYLVDMKLGEIRVRFLNPADMYGLYLKGDKKKLEELG